MVCHGGAAEAGPGDFCHSVHDARTGRQHFKEDTAVLCVSHLGKRPSQTAEIVLEGNPTTGFDWHWVVDGEGQMDIEREYEVDWQPSFEDDIMPPGTGGHSRFKLQGVAPGEVTITFTYRRAWEEKAPLYTLVYRVRVDEELNVSILGSSFDW